MAQSGEARREDAAASPTSAQTAQLTVRSMIGSLIMTSVLSSVRLGVCTPIKRTPPFGVSNCSLRPNLCATRARRASRPNPPEFQLDEFTARPGSRRLRHRRRLTDRRPGFDLGAHVLMFQAPLVSLRTFPLWPLFPLWIHSSKTIRRRSLVRHHPRRRLSPTRPPPHSVSTPLFLPLTSAPQATSYLPRALIPPALSL